MHDFDHSQRFIFDDNDVRGEMVSLGESYQHVLAKHPSVSYTHLTLPTILLV